MSSTTKTRPKIHRQRRGLRKGEHRPHPIRLCNRGATIKGLLEEYKLGNSTIKLYCLMALRAILATCGETLQKRYGPQIRRLAKGGQASDRSLID